MSNRVPLSVFVALSMILTVGSSVRAQNTAPASAGDQVKAALQNCYQCHGVGGVSVIPTRPTIAGQKSEYIRRQLVAFKHSAPQGVQDRDGDGDGELDEDVDNDAKGAAIPVRNDPVMEHMAAGLPDQLIAPLADAISKLACDGGTVKAQRNNPPARPAAAEACVVCHGVDGIGLQNQVPNLAGQHRAYLRRQLLLIRETAWGAQPREGEAWRSHPIMEAKVARRKIVDIDAMSRYFAALDCRGAGAAVSN